MRFAQLAGSSLRRFLPRCHSELFTLFASCGLDNLSRQEIRSRRSVLVLIRHEKITIKATGQVAADSLDAGSINAAPSGRWATRVHRCFMRSPPMLPLVVHRRRTTSRITTSPVVRARLRYETRMSEGGKRVSARLVYLLCTSSSRLWGEVRVGGGGGRGGRGAGGNIQINPTGTRYVVFLDRFLQRRFSRSSHERSLRPP